MISLREENDALRRKCDELEIRLASVNTEQEVPQPLPDLEDLRDRILSSLKLGTQASRYKTAKKVLDQFIKELSFNGHTKSPH